MDQAPRGSRRDFIKRLASVAALVIDMPMRTLQASELDFLGMKAGRGNRELIERLGIEVQREVVSVGSERYAHVVFRNPRMQGPTLFVPHDNEYVGFDAALRHIGEMGGTLVSLDSYGGRNLVTVDQQKSNQDPNRMFKTDSKYWNLAARLLEILRKDAHPTTPVVTLHNNMPLGSFAATINNPPKNIQLHMVDPSRKGDVVWISGALSAPDHVQAQVIASLTNKGMNALFESVNVAGASDGSLSQYCARTGVGYYNIETRFPGSATEYPEKLARQRRALQTVVETVTKVVS